MSAPAKTLRIAYMVHAYAETIIEEYVDGSTRRIKRPRSVEKMDKLRKRYGDRWRSVQPRGSALPHT